MVNSKIRLFLECRHCLMASAVLLATLFFFSTGVARQSDKLKAIDVGGLRVMEEAGNPRITLDLLRETGPVVSLNDPDGVPGILMMTRPNGSKAVILRRNKGLIGINVLPDGSAAINLGSLGRSGVILSAQEDGETSLQFSDKKGKVRIKLGLQSNGSPALEFFDEKGKNMFRTPVP